MLLTEQGLGETVGSYKIARDVDGPDSVEPGLLDNPLVPDIDTPGPCRLVGVEDVDSGVFTVCQNYQWRGLRVSELSNYLRYL